MTVLYSAAIALWPVSPLPRSLALELQRLGVDVQAQQVTNGSFLARELDGRVLLELSFSDRRVALSDLDGVLASARRAGISYLAWARTGESTGSALAFDPASGSERQFSVLADGTPVLTPSDLQQFEGQYRNAEELMAAMLAYLLPIPTGASAPFPGQATIVIAPDEADDDAPCQAPSPCK